jgi:uncharacterized protein (TIGR02594 family)
MNLTAFDLAQRYTGIQELPGGKNHPLIQWWLSLCGFGMDSEDEIAWCSAFLNGIAWELRLPRSKSAAARSWLNVGTPVPLEQAQVGFDVVVIQRGTAPQPGPEVINATGHVGFFAGLEGDLISILGGNTGDAVNVGRFNKSRLLGVRRLI